MRNHLTGRGINGEEKTFSISRNNCKNIRTGFIVSIAIVIILSILVAGCVSEPRVVAKNVTPATSLPPAAPHQCYVKTGQVEQFTYRGHTITVNYTSAYPLQIVKVGVDGSEKILQRELTERPEGIDWKEGDLSFTLKPVVWEIREGQNVPIYESTWNTSEVYFAVQVLLPLSEATGGPNR